MTALEQRRSVRGLRRGLGTTPSATPMTWWKLHRSASVSVGLSGTPSRPLTCHRLIYQDTVNGRESLVAVQVAQAGGNLSSRTEVRLRVYAFDADTGRTIALGDQMTDLGSFACSADAVRAARAWAARHADTIADQLDDMITRLSCA